MFDLSKALGIIVSSFDIFGIKVVVGTQTLKDLVLVWLCHLPLCSSPSSLQVTASCPAVCDCPADPLVCPPGVSTVPDGCGCCKVCAAQLNQDCSLIRPCDHHKGLECNYGNDVTIAWGICRGEGRGNVISLKNSCLYRYTICTMHRAYH